MSGEEIIRELAGVALGPQRAGADYALRPPGWEVLNLEQYQPAPHRIKRRMNHATAESFVEYLNKWKIPETELGAYREELRITAVIDCHRPRGVEHADGEAAFFGGPSWCDHVVSYTCPLTKQWQAWTMNNRNKLTQVQFAEWIEDHHEDFNEPAAAEFLDIATNLQIHRKAEFSSSVTLNTGEHAFAYTETNSSGTVAIPATFKIAIPVFEDGTVYKVSARLRYRLDAGKLMLWFELIDPDRYVDDAFNEALAAIEADTDLKAYRLAQ